MLNRKEATPVTAAANTSLLGELAWDDAQDFENAARGFIASLEDPMIRRAEARRSGTLDAYPFLAEETAPPSVNPSLWRAVAAECTLPRSLPGHGRRLPDPQLRSGRDEHHRERQRLCRRGPADGP